MGRPIRGSRQSAFFPVDPNPSLASLDSAFQLQEYISLLVRRDPHDVEHIVALPGRDGDTDAGAEKRQPVACAEDERVAVDEACWIYEQLRRLAQDLTHPLITTLQQECTRQSCPEMKAGEWLYLCVAHGNSGAMEHCCAIDYIVHTLDSATALLNSPRAFPSRISIPPTSHRHFPSLARRLGRIFAHAYHHHRDAFESAEAESALYARFLALSRRFDLVPPEFLVIPPRVEREDVEDRDSGAAVTLLTRPGLDEPVPERSPSPAPSPRIGGRARTDTMYHSGLFVPPAEGSPLPGPRLAPSALGEQMQTQTHEDTAKPQPELETGRVASKVVARDFAVGVTAGPGAVDEAGEGVGKESPPGDEQPVANAVPEEVEADTREEDIEDNVEPVPISPDEGPLSKAESLTLAMDPPIPSRTVDGVAAPEHDVVQITVAGPTHEEPEEPEKAAETVVENDENQPEAEDTEGVAQDADMSLEEIELDEKGLTKISTEISLEQGPEDDVEAGTESTNEDSNDAHEHEEGEIESE